MKRNSAFALRIVDLIIYMEVGPYIHYLEENPNTPHWLLKRMKPPYENGSVGPTYKRFESKRKAKSAQDFGFFGLTYRGLTYLDRRMGHSTLLPRSTQSDHSGMQAFLAQEYMKRVIRRTRKAGIPDFQVSFLFHHLFARYRDIEPDCTSFLLAFRALRDMWELDHPSGQRFVYTLHHRPRILKKGGLELRAALLTRLTAYNRDYVSKDRSFLIHE